MEILYGKGDEFRYCFYGFADFNDQLATIVNAIEWVGVWWLFATNRDDGLTEQSTDEETDADASQIVLIIITSPLNYMCCFARTNDHILQFRLIIEI